MKERIQKIKAIFDEIYGDACCSLTYEKPYELLIATRLAAQCTDARVNIVMKGLTKKYKSIYDFANADLEELMKDIHSTGFFRSKAKNIIDACKMIISDFGGAVPDNMDDLLKLPGVGRKTANLILGDVFKKPAIVVDTHAGRISRRIGLTKHTDPYKVELDLMKIIPPDYQSVFCHQLVYHGRQYCKSQRPNCEICPINDLCDKKI
ncbi:MAG: Ultraviolet N-glycosylase/AP lyase [Firmicutes bacterium ADurb.Bin193]|nr:MAG: Ultraviolet N-glycosylase/AP lyase [Firmicutes bacterium ADurb.Bin193]